MYRTLLRAGIVAVAIVTAVALGVALVPELRSTTAGSDHKPVGATVTLAAPAPRTTATSLPEPATTSVPPAPHANPAAIPRHTARPPAIAPIESSDDVTVTTINSW